MSILAHIADRALNRPLMITPAKAEVIVSILSGRIGLDAGEVVAEPEASRFAGRTRLQAAEGRAGMQPKPYPEENGVAIISIVGTLVNRGAWIGASSGLVSYEGVRHQIAEAARDADIKAIILDIHSSGGEATGAVETAAVVREVEEETGLSVVCGALLGWVERFGPDLHYVILDFEVTVLDDADPVAGDDAAEVAWVPLHEVSELDLVDGLAAFLAEHEIIRLID